ncbi:MAG: DinB family protein [Armatimonadota bacterium]|nr:DinB family protein [Armatimonadota bacterium]MDR7509439.1 DinB family protein [Armatimonadota bacterium]MDR7516351.1 DinB family protein [Armatimonadota bacterium]MDR7560031.1 DinB family protein [Armatimonadota bacterium]MDR7582074.1 DinB family protein [Armatimonadota bacterium]
MDPLVVPLGQVLEQVHDDIYAAVEPLDDDAVNWAHPHLANTIGILLRHIAGSERYWIVEVAGGRPVHRDRASEFVRERLVKADLLAALRAAHAEAQQVLRDLSAADLASEVDIEFRRTRRRVTRGWAILQAVQHTAYHLGQIRLFAKMATAGRDV